MFTCGAVWSVVTAFPFFRSGFEDGIILFRLQWGINWNAKCHRLLTCHAWAAFTERMWKIKPYWLIIFTYVEHRMLALISALRNENVGSFQWQCSGQLWGSCGLPLDNHSSPALQIPNNWLIRIKNRLFTEEQTSASGERKVTCRREGWMVQTFVLRTTN